MLALLFPGQGAQAVGMGRDAYEASAAARAVYDRADAALPFELSRLCFEGPEAEQRKTELQQPAILATSIAWLRALEERTPLAPAYVAGHSLGEYTALVASGSLPLEAALGLVQARGRFMQEAVPEGEGAMAAVMGCAPEVVEAACRGARNESGEIVVAANFNALQQTVISGASEAVDLACRLARETGARRTVRLPVSAPFHSPLMAPAEERLGRLLAEMKFADPRPPVVTNVEAEPNRAGQRVAELLRRQLTAPVRFTETIERLAALGVRRVLEVGPGRVLCGLVARIAPSLERGRLGCLAELDVAVRFVSRPA